MKLFGIDKWETKEDVISLLEAIFDSLKYDKWTNNSKKEKLRSNENDYTVERYCDFIFTIDYL